MPLPPPEIIALIGAVGGGIAAKLIDFLIARASKIPDEEKSFRDELRAERKEYKLELEAAELRFDELQEKYFALKEESVGYRAEIARLKAGAGD